MTDLTGKELDFNLVDEYVKTRDERYLNEWLSSQDGIEMCNRLSRFILSRNKWMAQSSSNAYTPEYILGDTYTSMVKVLRSYKPNKGATPQTYLYKYVPHQVIREITSNDFDVVSESSPITFEEKSDWSFFDSILARSGHFKDNGAISATFVQDTLSVLNEDELKIWKLNTVDGFSQKEIGEMYNLSANQVFNLMKSIREKLKNSLMEEGCNVTEKH